MNSPRKQGHLSTTNGDRHSEIVQSRIDRSSQDFLQNEKTRIFDQERKLLSDDIVQKDKMCRVLSNQNKKLKSELILSRNSGKSPGSVFSNLLDHNNFNVINHQESVSQTSNLTNSDDLIEHYDVADDEIGSDQKIELLTEALQETTIRLKKMHETLNSYESDMSALEDENQSLKDSNSQIAKLIHDRNTTDQIPVDDNYCLKLVNCHEEEDRLTELNIFKSEAGKLSLSLLELKNDHQSLQRKYEILRNQIEFIPSDLQVASAEKRLLVMEIRRLRQNLNILGDSMIK